MLGYLALAGYVATLLCAALDGTCLAFNPPQYVREIAEWLDRLERLRTGPKQRSLFDLLGGELMQGGAQ